MKQPELGKSFIFGNDEYEVSYNNIKENRFSAKPKLLDAKRNPIIGEKFTIEGSTYVIVYVHNSTKRITAKLFSDGY
jgi:hypothetical protein